MNLYDPAPVYQAVTGPLGLESDSTCILCAALRANYSVIAFLRAAVSFASGPQRRMLPP